MTQVLSVHISRGLCIYKLESKTDKYLYMYSLMFDANKNPILMTSVVNLHIKDITSLLSHSSDLFNDQII